MDLLLFIFAGCGCIFFMYFVCKKWISNLLACLLLPIKMEELGACKRIQKKRKEKKTHFLDWILEREKKREFWFKERKFTWGKKKSKHWQEGKRYEQKHSRKYYLKLLCGLIYFTCSLIDISTADKSALLTHYRKRPPVMNMSCDPLSPELLLESPVEFLSKTTLQRSPKQRKQVFERCSAVLLLQNCYWTTSRISHQHWVSLPFNWRLWTAVYFIVTFLAFVWLNLLALRWQETGLRRGGPKLGREPRLLHETPALPTELITALKSLDKRKKDLHSSLSDTDLFIISQRDSLASSPETQGFEPLTFCLLDNPCYLLSSSQPVCLHEIKTHWCRTFII